MNKANVEKAIAIMERVIERGDTLNMSTWQGGLFGLETCAMFTEEDLHNCGTAACFAGWVAVSPEFRAQGGHASNFNGSPILGSRGGESAIAYWLEISDGEAADLCVTGGEEGILKVYGTGDVDEVGPDDVLTALNRLRDTGSVYKETSA